MIILKMAKTRKNHCPLKASWVFFFSVLYFFCSAGRLSTQTPVTPGRVVGNISFTSVSPEVSNYLTSNPVVNWTGADPNYFPVQLYHIMYVQRSATALYTPVNTVPDGQTYSAASFDIYPKVGPGRRDFILEINPVILSNGAQYIFGSIDASSSSCHLCQNVLPLTDNPNGTQCDISECAVLLPLRLRFGGSDENKNAIDTYSPAKCTATAYVKEGSGSADFIKQAISETKAFSVDSLKTQDGEILPVLVRASGSVIRIAVECEVKIKDGETGYPINPVTGKTPLHTAIDLGPYACGVQPSAPIDVDVPTCRTGGPLQGLFDVNGHNETIAEVRIADYPWYYIYYTAAQPVPAGSLPTVPWRFQGVPEGDYELLARAILDDGNSLLEFPHRGSFNQRIRINRQQTTDLGSTFVAKPNIVRGRVVLVDPGGSTDLKGIKTNPLHDFYNYDESYMRAEGVDQVASTTPACCNKSSGFKGRSLGRLIGSYDSAQHIADLNYELLLAGLSPEDGSADGTEACPAPWNMAGLSTYMVTETVPPNTGYCYYLLKLNQYFPLLADVNAGPIQYPDQTICYGKIRLDFHVDPNLGTIYYPWLNFYQEGVDPGPNEFGTSYSLGSGYAGGTPRYSSESGSTATVTATLPAGLRYRISPNLYFLPAGQSSGPGTYMYFDSFAYPETGVLNCGSASNICVSLSDEHGNYSLLSINLPTNTNYCLTDGNLELDFSVNLSDGSEVAKVGYVLDPENIETASLTDTNAVIVCPSNCGSNPTYTISLSSLSPGPHALKIIAIAANGCSANWKYNFYVASQPLALQCPSDITVTLNPGETQIAASDARIADNLNATWTGGCNLPVHVYDDRPEFFTLGETNVNFWILGPTILSCSTKVTLKEAKERLVAFAANQNGAQSLKLYQIESGQLFWEKIVENLTWIEFNADGSRIGVCQKQGEAGKVDIYNVETSERMSSAQTGYIPMNMAFNPQDTLLYAVVCTKVGQTYDVSLFREGNLIQRDVLPQLPYMSVPKIAWSSDGRLVAVLFTRPIFNSSGEYVFKYRIHILEWRLTPDGITLDHSIEVEKSSGVREEEQELLFDSSNRLFFSSNKGISRVASDGTIGLIADLENDDIDMSKDRAVAALSRGNRVGLAGNIGSGLIPHFMWGPTIQNGKKLQVAMTDDVKYVAVQNADGVYIYRCEDFALVHSIYANMPMLTKFQPVY